MGREFGRRPGRARRCGWFDAVATHYATMINGIDELAITNLDGLDAVDPIRFAWLRIKRKTSRCSTVRCRPMEQLRTNL